MPLLIGEIYVYFVEEIMRKENFFRIIKSSHTFTNELLVYLLDIPDTVDLSISKQGTDPVIIRSSLLQLENYGLVISRMHYVGWE